MVRISVQAAHEQVNPIDLLDDVVKMDLLWLKLETLHKLQDNA